MPLRSIGLKQWDELVKTLSTAGLSARMKEYVTGTLRRVLKHAYDRRMVDDAPPSGKRVGISGPGNNRRLRVISNDEETAIMKRLEPRDIHAWRVTRFAFLTGCRVSEAFSLTWANVDHSRGSIIFDETKNRDPRTIPITPPLQELFDSMTAGASDAHVFTKEDGSLYQQAPSAFQTVVDNLGLNEGRTKRDRLVFHSIRHSVATRLAQKLGPRDLMDVMGWRTVQMAMRYVHSNETAKAMALGMLGTAPEEGKVLPFRAAEDA
jgi:integrase